MIKKYRIYKQANGKYIVRQGTPIPSFWFSKKVKFYSWAFYIVPFDTAELAETWAKKGFPSHEVVKEWYGDE